MSGTGVEIAALGLGIGLMFSLVCYLLTNLSPGGMITPGWLALALVATPERLIVIVVVTGLTTFGTITLRKHIILYGKRMFATVVMLGVFVQMTLVVLLADVIPGLTSGETIGFIIPGLMAYQLVRQPTAATLLAIGSVASMAYGVIVTGVLLGFVEESSRGFTSGISDGPLGLGGWGLLLVFATIGLFTSGLVLTLARIRRRAAPPPPESPPRKGPPGQPAPVPVAVESSADAAEQPVEASEDDASDATIELQPVRPAVSSPGPVPPLVPEAAPSPPLFGDDDEPQPFTADLEMDDDLVAIEAYAREFLPADEAQRLATDLAPLSGTIGQKLAIAVERVQLRARPEPGANAAALVRHAAVSVDEASRMVGADPADVRVRLGLPRDDR